MCMVEIHLKETDQEEDNEEDEAVLVNEGKLHIFSNHSLRVRYIVGGAHLLSL